MRLCVAMCLVPVLACAQAPVPPSPFPEPVLAIASQLRAAALEGSGAYTIVESLTTEVGARMAGTEADARAVRWAEARFKALGFDRVTLEPVVFPMWRRGAESAEVLSPAPQKLSLLALGFSSGTPKGGIEAEVDLTIALTQRDQTGQPTGNPVVLNGRRRRFLDEDGVFPDVYRAGELTASMCSP